MLAAGALDEVAALRAAGPTPDLPAMKAVGVRELLASCAGRLDLEAALARAIATRQYAKRQRTWFRHQLPELQPRGGFGESSELLPGWLSRRPALVDRSRLPHSFRPTPQPGKTRRTKGQPNLLNGRRGIDRGA